MKRHLKVKAKPLKTSAQETVQTESEKKNTLTKSLDDNLTRLKDALNNSYDIKERKFRIGNSHTSGAVLYIKSLVKEDTVMEFILKPMMAAASLPDKVSFDPSDFDTIKNTFILTGNIKEANTFDELILHVLSGNTLILIEGCDKGLLMGTESFSGRDVSEPEMEPSVKGPKESFVENLKDNLGLIRKRLRDPNLMIENHKIGRRSKLNVLVIHIKGVARREIVDEVVKRIKAVDIDDGVGSGQLAQLICDRPNSIFPLIQLTERPDKIIASLLEGRVAIMMEGSPAVMLVPVTLPILMQSADDFYEKWLLASAIRLGRYFALFTSALFPALYIALTSFHPGILPTIIVLSITGTRMGVPFPAFIEALLMAATLELLVEAGIRLPKVVGQTVSIVGGLVIGQAAVEAGVISPVMVIVIAITAISSFTIPDYSLGLAVRILRIPFMLSATLFGAVGTSLLLLAMLGYTASLESFGVGYLEPISPYRLRDWKDTLITGPQGVFGKRPEFLKPEDTQRQLQRKEGKSGAGKK